MNFSALVNRLDCFKKNDSVIFETTFLCNSDRRRLRVLPS